MNWNCPQQVEDSLWEAASVCVPESALARAGLVRAIVDRSKRYTDERERIGEQVGGRALAPDLAARALFFTVADVAKVWIPLAELTRNNLLPTDGTLRILDIGAGVGAMSLGIASCTSLSNVALSIEAIDTDARALEWMSCALSRYAQHRPAPISVVTRVQDARKAKFDGGYDLVVVGTALNEMSETAAAGMVADLVSKVAPSGAVIVIEPALRATSRRLHRLRDTLIEQQTAHVYAPCTRTAAPCTALARDTDWCHEDRPTVLPARTRQLARATGLRSHGLKFSYLVLRREPAMLVADKPAWRMVSRVRQLKGKHECFGCGEEAGQVRFQLLKKHRSAANRGFIKARRGDVIVGPAQSSIEADQPVSVVRPTEAKRTS